MNLQHGANIEVIYQAECEFLNEFQPQIQLPPLEEFFRHYADAPGIRFMADEHCVGGIVVKDRMAHIGVLKAYRGVWARLWPEAYRWMFTVSDPVYALMARDNAKAIALVCRTGGRFVKDVQVPPIGDMVLYELRSSTTPYPTKARVRWHQEAATC
jgi:hypothetical protein